MTEIHLDAMDSLIEDNGNNIYSNLDLSSILLDNNENPACGIDQWHLDDDGQKTGSTGSNGTSNVLVFSNANGYGNTSQYYIVPSTIGSYLPEYSLVPETLPDGISVDQDIEEVDGELLLSGICEQKAAAVDDTIISDLLADSFACTEAFPVAAQNEWINFDICNDTQAQADFSDINEVISKVESSCSEIPRNASFLECDTDNITLKEVTKVYRKRSKNSDHNVCARLKEDTLKEKEVVKNISSKITILKKSKDRLSEASLSNSISGSVVKSLEVLPTEYEGRAQEDKTLVQNSKKSENTDVTGKSKGTADTKFNSSNNLILENAILLGEIEKLQQELMKVREERDRYKQKVEVCSPDIIVIDRHEDDAASVPCDDSTSQTVQCIQMHELPPSVNSNRETTHTDELIVTENMQCFDEPVLKVEVGAEKLDLDCMSQDDETSLHEDLEDVKPILDVAVPSVVCPTPAEEVSANCRPKRNHRIPLRFDTYLMQSNTKQEDGDDLSETSFLKEEKCSNTSRDEDTLKRNLKCKKPRSKSSSRGKKVRRKYNENVVKCLPETKITHYDSVIFRSGKNCFVFKNNLKYTESSVERTCKICGKYFAKSNELTNHYRLHSLVRPFVCRVCHATFKNKRVLKTHKRLHTGNMFHCSMCNKAYVAKSGLNIHMRFHMNQKPFMCKFCGKCFRHSGHLTEHERLHTGEKPYQCYVCRRSFPNCGNLYKHMRSIHKCNNPKEILDLYEMNDIADPVYLPDEEFGVLPRFTEACAS